MIEMKAGTRESAPIRAEQVEEYRRNGYVVVSGLFTAEDCDRIQDRVRRHVNADFAAILNPAREDFLRKQDPNSSEEEIRRTAEFLSGVMKDPRVAAILEALQGREVVGLMSQILFKEAGSRYASQAWNPHQDNHYPQNPNKQYITTNLFLENADRENGGMYFYPGSHAEDILPTHGVISYREPEGSNPGSWVDIPSKYSKVDLTTRKGDLLVLNGNTIHGSYPNHSKRSRPLFSCSYISKGEFFIPGKNADRRVVPLRD